jgi:hypothetical protein
LPAIKLDLEKRMQCRRCVTTCEEMQGMNVLPPLLTPLLLLLLLPDLSCNMVHKSPHPPAVTGAVHQVPALRNHSFKVVPASQSAAAAAGYLVM